MALQKQLPRVPLSSSLNGKAESPARLGKQCVIFVMLWLRLCTISNIENVFRGAPLLQVVEEISEDLRVIGTSPHKDASRNFQSKFPKFLV